LVNFRLTVDEFERLRMSCDAAGARSISDYARKAVLVRLDRNGAGEEGRVTGLDGRVATLEARVVELIRLLEATGRPEAVAQTATGA
jgi:hypothetical protein